MPGLVDVEFLLFEQSIYNILGDDTVFTLDDTTGTQVTLRVTETTVAAEVLDAPGIVTIIPAANIRAAQLAEKGYVAKDLRAAALTLNGKNWTVVDHAYLPTSEGETKGQIKLMLEQADGV